VRACVCVHMCLRVTSFTPHFIGYPNKWWLCFWGASGTRLWTLDTLDKFDRTESNGGLLGRHNQAFGLWACILWDIMRCSSMEVARLFGRINVLHFQFRRVIQAKYQYEVSNTELVSCLVFSSNLKMEAIYSSDISTGFHRTIWRYIL
jgi:hypothetical protein